MLSKQGEDLISLPRAGWAWSTGRGTTNVTHGSFSNIPMTPHTVKGSANFETYLADELLEKKKKDILSFFDIKEVREPEKVKKKRDEIEKRERKHSSHSSSKKRRHSSRSESRSESQSRTEKRAKYKLPVEHESQRQKYHIMQKIAKRKAAVIPALYPKSGTPSTAMLTAPDYTPAYNTQYSSNTNNRQHEPYTSRPILPLPTLDYQNISPPHQITYSPHGDFNPNDFEFEDYDEHNRPVENNNQHTQSPQFDEGYSFKDGVSQRFTGHNQTVLPPNQYYNQQQSSEQYHDEPAHTAHYVEASYDPGSYVDPNTFYRIDGAVKTNLSRDSGAKWH